MHSARPPSRRPLRPHRSIKAETLGRLMEREGALDSKGMVSAKSFSVRGQPE